MPKPEPANASEEHPRIVIAGGGVAALEALIALRDLLDRIVSIEMVAPTGEFVYRPLSVTEPFGSAASPRFDLAKIAADHGASLHHGIVDAVDHDRMRVSLRGGRLLPFDVLLLAIGARPCEWLAGAIPFAGPEDVPRLRALIGELEDGSVDRIIFTAPPALHWTFPLYELALLTAARVAERRLADVHLTIATPEPSPLEVFGASATRHVRELCADRGIALKTAVRARSFENGRLELESGEYLQAEGIVALPELKGEPIAGVPCDDAGFIPVDEHGAVRGLPGVYAAGDGARYPIKQGGLAAQQADAAAEAIAAYLGTDIEPQPFSARLRGELLTGLEPTYLVARAAEAGSRESNIAFEPLWSPRGKIASRYLAPYLAELASLRP
ncbi:MAG TPA: FAD-dependent oxidoreductase [Solirubrobacteraceae bacterium]|nr:FAD-dependent oxidoreductase [Solirubrobacteraceae bacterium]